jgi:hypothetical protein
MENTNKIVLCLKGNKGRGVLAALVGTVAVIIMLQTFVIVISSIRTETSAFNLSSDNGDITSNMYFALPYPLIAVAGLIIGVFIILLSPSINSLFQEDDEDKVEEVINEIEFSEFVKIRDNQMIRFGKARDKQLETYYK